jgi:prepilin-type N-terminal cleavage/methylation domain-containing protein
MRRNRGFTLLEVLVTLVVLGLLLVGLTQGMHFGMRAWALQAASSDTDLDATDRALRALIVRSAPTRFRDSASFIGTERTLSLTTELPTGNAALPTREADVTLSVDALHRLTLSWRPHYHNWIVTPPPPASTVLLDQVDHIDLAYWQPGTPPRGGSWRSDWTARLLPPLVRIRIVFSANAHRRWPDIIASPMREPAEP